MYLNCLNTQIQLEIDEENNWNMTCIEKKTIKNIGN